MSMSSLFRMKSALGRATGAEQGRVSVTVVVVLVTTVERLAAFAFLCRGLGPGLARGGRAWLFGMYSDFIVCCVAKLLTAMTSVGVV